MVCLVKAMGNFHVSACLPVVLLVVALGEETLSLEPLNALGLACVLVLKNVSVCNKEDTISFVVKLLSPASLFDIFFAWKKYISTTKHSVVVTCWRWSQP